MYVTLYSSDVASSKYIEHKKEKKTEFMFLR